MSIFCFIFCLMPHNTQSVCEPGPTLFIIMFFVTIVLQHNTNFNLYYILNVVTATKCNIHKCGNIKFWSTHFMIFTLVGKCNNTFCYLYPFKSLFFKVLKLFNTKMHRVCTSIINLRIIEVIFGKISYQSRFQIKQQMHIGWLILLPKSIQYVHIIIKFNIFMKLDHMVE